MAQIIKRKNGSLFPELISDFFSTGFFGPSFEKSFFDGGIKFPPANIIENSHEYRIDLQVPGLKKDVLKVSVEKRILIISCDKKDEKKPDEIFKERAFSHSYFSRSFFLPDNIDEDKISATCENGILKIILPKKEISIKRGRSIGVE